MKRKGRLIAIVFLSFLSLTIAVYFLFFSERYPLRLIRKAMSVGSVMDSIDGVYVYNNGLDYVKSYGKNYSADSVYLGRKWQCVEFVKRYYFQHFHHVFPDGWGNAHEFFDANVPQGGMNKRRGLLQFRNGGNENVRHGDLLVFDGPLGHVAIVNNVKGDLVEIVQQNIFMQPRQFLHLIHNGDYYTINGARTPLGWLRPALP